MPRRSSALRPQLFMVSTVLIAGLWLTACTPSPGSTPSPEPTASSGPSASPTPEAPQFHADGTAEENLPVFTSIVEQVSASDEKASGRAYIDALVNAGFDRASMQVTPDESTVGNPSESLQFSVRWGENLCLMGQVGPSTGEPVTVIMEQLPDGVCLIGNTRPIDW